MPLQTGRGEAAAEQAQGLEAAPAAYPKKPGAGVTEGSGAVVPAAGALGARGRCLHGDQQPPIPGATLLGSGAGTVSPGGSPRVVRSPRSGAPQCGSSLLNPPCRDPADPTPPTTHL